MASALEQAIWIGEETAWASPAPPAAAYEADADKWALNMARIAPSQTNPAIQAELADYDRPAIRSVTGDLDIAWMPYGGMDLPLKHLLGGRRDIDDRTVEYHTTAAGPAGSYTVSVYRVDFAGGGRVYRHLGCVPQSFTLDVSVGGPLRLAVRYEGLSAEITTGATAPPYPDGGAAYRWDECTVEADGSILGGVRSFTLAGRLGMRPIDAARPFDGAVRPVRSAPPAFIGQIQGLMADDHEWAKFVSGAVFPVVLRAVRGDASVTVTMPACKYLDSRQRMHRGRLTAQDLPFKAYWRPPSDAVTIRADTTR